jgi:hypothetical protein
MVLLFHIVVAFASLIAAGAAYLSPSLGKLRLAYVLAASMLASGTYLVVRNSSHLLEACVMGLVYLVIISYEIAVARSKLASVPAEIDT